MNIMSRSSAAWPLLIHTIKILFVGRANYYLHLWHHHHHNVPDSQCNFNVILDTQLLRYFVHISLLWIIVKWLHLKNKGAIFRRNPTWLLHNIFEKAVHVLCPLSTLIHWIHRNWLDICYKMTCQHVGGVR